MAPSIIDSNYRYTTAHPGVAATVVFKKFLEHMYIYNFLSKIVRMEKHHNIIDSIVLLKSIIILYKSNNLYIGKQLFELYFVYLVASPVICFPKL